MRTGCHQEVEEVDLQNLTYCHALITRAPYSVSMKRKMLVELVKE